MSNENEILTHDEVLAILSRQAEEGSVTAAAALERALRIRETGTVDQALADELDALIERRD